jgi:endonuclease/exonuclease/phosphatase family metal-dependent hydrolase
MRFRVATYNIHRCVGRDHRESPSRIIRVVRHIDPDVIALQEVAMHSAVSSNILLRLADATSMIPVEGFTLRNQAGHYGNAVLMKVPPLEIHRMDLSVPRREPRGLLDLRFQVNGHAITLLATHLGLGLAERRRQIRRLSDYIDTVSADTTIVMGDMNEWYRWSGPLRRLVHQVGPSSQLPTFPAHRPILSLDRIWVLPASRQAVFNAPRNDLTRTASDHLPLIADIDLPMP